MAPFTIHLHALETQLAVGDPLTARYQWTCAPSAPASADDPRDALVGWNAAFTLDRAGQYRITLQITDEQGEQASVDSFIDVLPSDRKIVFVSNAGRDENPGTVLRPVRTLAGAMKSAGDRVAILLRRGEVFTTDQSVEISGQDVLIGAFGNGPPPEIHWTGDAQTVAAMIAETERASRVIVQDVHFTSTQYPPTNSSVRALHPAGGNFTVRRCRFGNVSFALNCEQGIDGLLAQDNIAGLIGAYFSWAQGRDHVYRGNVCAGSVSQHVIRLGGVERCLIAGNTLTNPNNSTVWGMLGSHLYITGNTLSHGRCIVGPNQAVGEADERFEWAVIEANHMIDEGFGVDPGGEHVMIRNNVIERDDGSAITIKGWDAQRQRAARDVRVLNNTALNRATGGRFINIGNDVPDVLVANNIYAAPRLETGSNQTANVYLEDDSMNGAQFRTNLWSNPARRTWGDGWHYFCDHWSSVDGYYNITRWSALNNVHAERYRTFADGDFDPQFRPSFDAACGQACAGVLVDMYGTPRPCTGVITVGAVQAPAARP